MWGEWVRKDATQCLVRMEDSWGKEIPPSAARKCGSLSRTGAPNLWTSPGSFHPGSDTLIVGKPVKIFEPCQASCFLIHDIEMIVPSLHKVVYL